MSFLASITGSKAIVSVLAIGAGSVLGYNWVTTGCPSGTCPTERAAARITQASMVETEDLGSACSTKSADSCCPLMAEANADSNPATTDFEDLPYDHEITLDVPSCCDDLPNCCMEKEDCCGSAAATAEQTASNAP